MNSKDIDSDSGQISNTEEVLEAGLNIAEPTDSDGVESPKTNEPSDSNVSQHDQADHELDSQTTLSFTEFVGEDAQTDSQSPNAESEHDFEASADSASETPADRSELESAESGQEEELDETAKLMARIENGAKDLQGADLIDYINRRQDEVLLEIENLDRRILNFIELYSATNRRDGDIGTDQASFKDDKKAA